MPSVSTTFTTAASAARAGSIGGLEHWTPASSALTSDDNRAEYGTNIAIPWPAGYTAWLQTTELTDGVPAGATVDGILVSIERRKDIAGSTLVDSSVNIIKEGSVGSTNKSASAVFTNSDSTVTFGGSADLWDETWTVDQINATDFGVSYSVHVDQTFEEEAVPQVDAITVEVFYTGGGGGDSRRRIQAVSWM